MTAGTTVDRQSAATARKAVLSSSRRFWRPADLNLPDSTAQHLLAALVDAGELRHVRRGLYWRGVKTPLGMSPPPQDALVSELAPGRGVGLSGLSAANLLRLSTQIPKRAEYAVPGRAPADTGSVKFVSRAARKGRVKSRLNPTEVAALEVLDAWSRVIEVSPNDAMRRLAELVNTGAIRAEKLANAATTETSATQKRLHTLLERAGETSLAAKVAEPTKKKAHKSGYKKPTQKSGYRSMTTSTTGTTATKTMKKSDIAKPRPASAAGRRSKTGRTSSVRAAG